MDGQKGDRELSFGEKAVDFKELEENLDARSVRILYAGVIDSLNDLRNPERSERNRLLSTAITQAEIACMCAVKATYRKD